MPTDAWIRVSELYRGMADRELRAVSPIYESLCRAVAASPAICALVADLPPAKWQPNLLLGVVRLLGGPIHRPADFLEFVRANWTGISASMLTHSTQTNEPGRCAVLLPLLAQLQGPLALIEVGASAGLVPVPRSLPLPLPARNGREPLPWNRSRRVDVRCGRPGTAA